MLDNMTLVDRIKCAVAVSEFDLDWSYGALDDDHVIVCDNKRRLEHCVSRSESWREVGKFTYDVETFKLGAHRAHCGAHFNERAKFLDVFKYILRGGEI